MEYLILQVFVGAILCAASYTLFYGYRPEANDGKQFGPVGEELQKFYQRTLGGIALPFP